MTDPLIDWLPCLRATKTHIISSMQEPAVVRAVAGYLYHECLLPWDQVAEELKRLNTRFTYGAKRAGYIK